MKLRVLVMVIISVSTIPFSFADRSEVDPWLDTMAERMAGVQSLDQRAVMKTDMVLHGMEHEIEQHIQLVFQRPNRLVIDLEYMKVVADGETVYLYSRHQDRYVMWPIEDSLESTLKAHDVHDILQLWTWVRALLSSDPLSLLQALRDDDLEILPDEEVDGVSYSMIRHGIPGMMGRASVDFTAWIDQTHGLVQRAEVRPPEESAKDDDKHRFVHTTFKVTSQQVNEPISDDAFAFEPGEDTEKVDSFLALWRVDDAVRSPGSGLAPFPLSGKPAPDFELTLLDGEVFRLSEQEGKIVVLDFWATWCGPCVRALPDIRKLDEAYRDQGVVVVGISRDRPAQEQAVRDMAAEEGLDYAIGIDVDAIADDYLVRGIPCVVVIDGDGIVQGRKVGYSPAGMQALKKDLDRLLAGESLEAARPLTKKEIKAMEASRSRPRHVSRTVMDEIHFRPVWQLEGGTRERTQRASHFGHRVQVRIARSTFVLPQGDQVAVIRAKDGESLLEITLPEEARKPNIMQQRPSLIHLRHPDGGVVLSAQQYYEQTETDRGGTSYSTTNIAVRAYGADGEERWMREFGRDHFVRTLEALPVSEDEDVLLLATWNQFVLINAQGDELLSQSMGHADQVDVTRDPADGRLLFYLTGSVNACYELIMPEPEPMIEFAGE